MTRSRSWLIVILAAGAALGVVYLVVTPPGLPYDEPSHWFNVQYYLEYHRMPVIGDPGVTYEAQMGPVAYVLMALVALPWWPASPEVAFYAARTLGLVGLLLLVVLVWRLTRKALPGRPEAALLAAAVLALNPMLLAMSTSIQNDVLAILLATAAVDVATSGSPASVRRSVVVGGLVGLALLTKVTVWPVGVVLGVWMLWRRRYGVGLAYGLTVLLVSGWWFVRNLRLYGDLTGQDGVQAAGYDFPPLGWDPVQIGRAVVTYLWIPVEYVRNSIEAPVPVEVGVALLTGVGLVAAWLSLRALELPGRLLGAIAVVAVVCWVVIAVELQAVAFRFAYVALPAWFVAFGWLATRSRGRVVGAGVLVSVLALDAWFLLELRSLADPGLLDPTVVANL